MSNERRDEHMMVLARAFLRGLRQRDDRADYRLGGWALDDKGPYGGYEIEEDILAMLGEKAGREGFTAAQREYAAGLYAGLADFLRERVDLALKPTP